MTEEEVQRRLREFIQSLKADGADEETIGKLMNELSETIYYELLQAKAAQP